ncbi:MAG: RNA polymerase sigma factor [Bryobacterales bacterium]|nr:RNA polymerase sigma factor [Bryobacterales bacterium]
MSLRDTTYSELSRAAAAGDACASFAMDEESFRTFYERTARSVWAYLARITGDRHLADDLLQESYYRFLRAGASYESEAHRRNSLYRIATNLARDARRRSAARGLAGYGVEHVPGGDDAARAERAADVTRALAQLKPRERELLWLAYAEGASHEEIAATLGLRPASLKALLFRARRRLAALLSPREREGCDAGA